MNDNEKNDREENPENKHPKDTNDDNSVNNQDNQNQDNSKLSESNNVPVAKNLINHEIEDEMKNSYIDYAMSVIVGRALPDVRDGLKPVHRRVLFSMYKLGIFHNKPFKKCARIVGDCLGKYHPHGDIAVYDTLVRMAQDFSLRYPLIDGQGNFGSVDGDSPAAMRYTEARLSKIAEEMLKDIDTDTVNFVPNFDGSLKEPEVLPANLPNLLVNGSSGIAVGMATNMPPHNLNETCEAIKSYIDNPSITIDELSRIMQGPDFPTGGIIIGTSGIKNYYYTGKGKVKVRAKSEVITKKEKSKIIINELPYQVNKANLIKNIADLVKNKIIDGISDIRDESDREGIRVVIEVKKNYNPEILLNKLYKHTALQTTFGVDMLALVDNVPKRLNLKQIIYFYVKHREEVVKRRLEFELRKDEARLHILQGLIKALLNLDETIRIIKSAKDVKDAKDELISFLEITETQAQAILDLKLQRLTSLEQEKIKIESKTLEKRIDEIREILASEDKILEIIKTELSGIEKTYGDNRRTEIIESNEEYDEELDDEKLIDDEENVIIVTRAGYIKRMKSDEYRTQNRGGRGVYGLNMKDEDEVKDIFVAFTLDYILFFSNKGKVYWKKVYQLPVGSRQSKGKAIVNLIKTSEGEKITSSICIRSFDDKKYIFFVTKKGVVKRVNLIHFSNPRKGGIIAINLDTDDTLIKTFVTDGSNEIIIATKNGFAARFNEKEVRPTGRNARGVKGITLKGNDEVISAAPVENDTTLLTITSRGFGKRTRVEDYRLTRRGAKGVINQICNEKTGSVIDVLFVKENENLIVITKKGVVIKIPVSSVHISGRNTKGVRIIKLTEGDEVVSIDKNRDLNDESDENNNESESDKGLTNGDNLR
ncbi:MAG: DNA gyrase subunit A [Nitrospiraceae bacterium]|nr:DNA gyrase subunit A [Nitrospiraceae bacterium]